MSIEIPTELFLSCIENHPVIWDKTMNKYRSRQEYKQGWYEVCLALHSGYNDLEEREKCDFSKYLINFSLCIK